jgi:hypothetical protein
MSIDLNIEDESSKPNSDSTKTLSKKAFLADLTVHDIAREFSDEDSSFIRDNRVLLIPIGFPQAGKSVLLSSLMFYARKGKDTLFRTNLVNDYPFDKGRVAADQMVSYFNKKELYQSTEKGTLDLIGVDIEPRKSNLPKLNLAFLDLAGEDIKGIKTSEGAVFTDKINAVFNGVKTAGAPVVFILITPFEPPRKDNETARNAHDREDALHYDFLNYIQMNQPELLKNSKFFIVVSQWDRNPDQKLDVETYIREKRPSIYAYVKNSTVVWGEYSIGTLLESTVDGVQIQTISRINYEYPSRFWKKLYQICTNKSLDQKTFWEKLFG